MCPKPEAGGNGVRAPVLGVEMIGGAMLLLGFEADLCSIVSGAKRPPIYSGMVMMSNDERQAEEA